MSDLPALHVESVRCVRGDGDHNAFTDLCRFAGRWFVTFRACPDGHAVSARARVVILASDDARDWREVCAFAVPQRDPRDPHFLELGGRLFVITGTWLALGGDAPLDLNDHLGWAVHTADGQAWEGPEILEGTHGHYVWRAAAHDGVAYLCGRRRRHFRGDVTGETEPADIESAMLESDDGLVWRHRALFAPDYGDETAFLFDGTGTITALARDGAGERARLCRSAPPYRDWQRLRLARNVGGPLLARWGAGLLVGGRRSDPEGPVTALSWLVDDALVDVAVLPSGGDTSYPGFVALDDERGVVSWYSSHAGRTAVYLADLRLG